MPYPGIPAECVPSPKNPAESTKRDPFRAIMVTGRIGYSPPLMAIWEAFGKHGKQMAILRRVSSATGKTAYQVMVDRRDPISGARKRVTVGTYRTKKEAEKAERDALTQQERGTLLDPTRTTVAELLNAWLATKRGEITGQSVVDYEIIIRKHIIPALGDVAVQKLTAPRVQAQYGAWSEAGMSPRLVRGCHMRLSPALKQAVRFGIVAFNVCDSVSPPTLGRSKADTWNAQEAALFLDASTADGLHPLWHLLLREGMRRGEALGLRWRDVDLERGTAHIVQTVAPDKADKGKARIQERTKTHAGARSVRLTAGTLAVLKAHRTAQRERRVAAAEWCDHDLIVCSSGRVFQDHATGEMVTQPGGMPINPGNVARNFTALIKTTGLRRIRPHDLRHTSATLLLLANTPAKIVSERLGHASVGITLDLYSHVLPDMQADAALAMDGILDHAMTGTEMEMMTKRP